MVLPFCVYVLFSEKDLLLYHGFTKNIKARLKDHSQGGTKSTVLRRLFSRPIRGNACENTFGERHINSLEIAEDNRKRPILWWTEGKVSPVRELWYCFMEVPLRDLWVHRQ